MIFEKIPLDMIFEKFRAAILLRIGIQSNWHCCMNWLSWTSAVQLSDIRQVRDYRFQVRREITHRVDDPKTWTIIRLECQGLILPGRFRRRDCSWSRRAVCVPKDSRGPGFRSMSYRVGPNWCQDRSRPPWSSCWPEPRWIFSQLEVHAINWLTCCGCWHYRGS